MRTTGDVRRLVDDAKSMAGSRVWRTTSATVGERLMLERLRIAAPDGQTVEVLHLVEVDAQGRILAVILFDADDLRAASSEMVERYALSDEGRRIPPALGEFLRAYRDHDLARLRAMLPDDYVLDDHRRTGVGRLEGAEAQVAAVAEMFRLTPDAMLAPLYIIAVEERGLLAMMHLFGTLADGGAFETIFLALAHFRDGRYAAMEFFESEDLERARARLHELGRIAAGAARLRTPDVRRDEVK
jgi:ketosteroid isomerase-like protein